MLRSALQERDYEMPEYDGKATLELIRQIDSQKIMEIAHRFLEEQDEEPDLGMIE